MTKLTMYICGLLILITGIGFYFYQRNTPPPDVVKIYKSTSILKQKSPKTPKNSETVQVKHVHRALGTSAESDSTFTPSQDVSQETSPVPSRLPTVDRTDTVLSTSEVQETENSLLETESEFDREAWIDEHFEQLNTWFSENYPDVVEATQMTREEYFEIYNTPEAARAIRERAKQASNEMFEQLRTLFSEMPTSMAEEFLESGREHFTPLWGTEETDRAIEKFRVQMGL